MGREHPLAGDALELGAARATIAAALFPSLDTPPAVVGRYQLRRRLGAGGMGVVFAAHDPHLRRSLAIKLLHPSLHAAKGADELLLNEARSTAQLVHPCVVTVFDAGLHEGRIFLAMELVDGQTMAQWLTSRPPWRQTVAALAKAARGIEAAHARGIVHRDFKPANVLLGVDGRVCVADFGLAREIGEARFPAAGPTGHGQPTRLAKAPSAVAGTPAYMAPEQYLGMVQDERTDQFAFCVSLYEALWGRRPFDARSLEDLKAAILTAAPPMPASPEELPRELTSAVSRGLSKRRQDRFASMGELASLLESLTPDVDLAEALSDRISVADVQTDSTYQAYLRMLPAGLDTTPEHRLPSRVTRLILAQKPLEHPPPEMVAVLAALQAEESIPAVHGRALLSAFYDEHFVSLEAFEAFMGPVSQAVMKVFFGLSAVPSPSSPHYVEVLLSIYNNAVQGMDLRPVEMQSGSAVIRVEHPPDTVNDVCRVSMAAVVRAAMLVTGCTIAEVAITAAAPGRFEMKAQWR